MLQSLTSPNLAHSGDGLAVCRVSKTPRTALTAIHFFLLQLNYTTLEFTCQGLCAYLGDDFFYIAQLQLSW